MLKTRFWADLIGSLFILLQLTWQLSGLLFCLTHSPTLPPKSSQHRLVKVHLCGQPLTRLHHVWVEGEGEGRGGWRGQIGIKQEWGGGGQIYVGVRPFSAPVCPDWRETSAPLIQCFPRDNKSERVRSVREGRESLSYTPVSEPSIQKLLS